MESINKNEEETNSELPPSYEHATSSSTQNNANQQNEEKLPPYSQFSKGNAPPSYKLHPDSSEDIRVDVDNFFTPSINQHTIVMEEQFNNQPLHNSASDECMFWSSLWISVLFNWIGFFIGYCLIGTDAARSGCVAGLGLSLINCLLYTRNSHFDDEHVFYVWWLLFILSILMVFRGFIEGAKLRKKRREEIATVDQAPVY